MMMATTNDIPAASVARVMGRHVIQDDSIRFDWPGVHLTFCEVKGTTTIALRMKGGGSVFGYQISEKPPQILNCFWNRVSEKTYILGKGLDPSQSYMLEIWKRNDPGNGIVQVSALVLDKEGTCAIATPSPRKLIEFVGDSDTVGFGNMAAKSGMLYSLLCEFPCMSCGIPKYVEATDSSQSWPAHLSQSLDVDYGIIAQSGIGAMYGDYVKHNMIEVYARSLNDDAKSKSEPLAPVDAVLVYIGMNDLADLKSSLRDTEKCLLKGFRELLTVIRQERPNVNIIVVVPKEDAILACVVSERENGHACKIQSRVWKQAVKEMGGEEKGFYIVENRHEPQINLNSKVDYGMMLHWNAMSCKKWANGLTDSIRKTLADELGR